MQKELLKAKIKENYGKIALEENIDFCWSPQEVCCSDTNNISKEQVSTIIGYNEIELKSIPKESILGLGCGAPLTFSDLKTGETLVDLGSGAGIDAFLASKLVGNQGKIIGIDMTDKMLEKAKQTAKDNNYKNVEFRKGDIEERIPIEDNSVDVVISNCVINLTSNKVKTFSEIHRILKPNGIGRMVISDLVTDKQIEDTSLIDPDKWCSCIDGALTKENYIASIKKDGFDTVEVLDGKVYTEGDHVDNRKITSLVIKAVKT